MISQKESFMKYNDAIDCRTYLSPVDFAATNYDVVTAMETLQRSGMTPIGQQEEVVSSISIEEGTIIDFKRAFIDLCRRVSELEHTVSDNTLYFESCEEEYAEEWRET